MISATIRRDHYRTIITNENGISIISDEPVDLGGKAEGFDPFELLGAALASCTAATLRMYADRKEWDIEEIIIKVDVNRVDDAYKTVINRVIEIPGHNDPVIFKRLLDIANKCPVHKVLSQTIEIDTTIQ
jgi:putative redox protein